MVLSAPLARIAAGMWAAARGQGEIAGYQGLGGKLAAATALIRGDLGALRLLPRMLRKRRQIRRIRKLSPRQLRALILGHRISLRALSLHAA